MALMATVVPAQAQTEGEQVEDTPLYKAMEQKRSLEQTKKELEKQRRQWQDSLSALERRESKLNKDIKAKDKEIEKLAEQRQKSEFNELYARWKQLQDEEQARRQTLADLEAQISQLDTQLDAADTERDKLLAARSNFAAGLIERHTPTARTAFSKMKVQELDAAIADCDAHSDDPDVARFGRDLRNVRIAYTAYTDADAIVKRPYDDAAINRTTAAISNARSLTPEQTGELAARGELLKIYPQGLQNFKTFIIEINKMVKSSPADFPFSDTDVQITYEQDGLNERIEATTLKIPYLSEKFREYKKAVSVDPRVQSPIAAEILNQ